MLSELIQLVVLFFVIIDPVMSMGIFFGAASKLLPKEKTKTAIIAITIAVLLSALFLVFGEKVLTVLQIKLSDFQIAGGIILGLLGIQMVLGKSEESKYTHEKAQAVAAVIGTPILTGPATITTIIISTNHYGMLITGLALLIVFTVAFLLLYFASKVTKFLGPNTIKVITTLLGIVTLVYGVAYIKTGFGL